MRVVANALNRKCISVERICHAAFDTALNAFDDDV
jgi:hypothetical protein